MERSRTRCGAALKVSGTLRCAARRTALTRACPVSYEGRLSDGTVFDRRASVRSVRSAATPLFTPPRNSCLEDGTTFGFQVGAGKVIRGWDVGVATMRVGERAELVCTSAYAYGAAGSPPDIPPDATLTFVVELLEVKAPRAAGGAKVDAAAELARLSLQREERAASAAVAAAERQASAQKREEAKAAAASRLASKGTKKGGKR